MNESLWHAAREMEPVEFEKLKHEIGQLMGLTYTRVLQPIYDEHPSLTPPALLSDSQA